MSPSARLRTTAALWLGVAAVSIGCATPTAVPVATPGPTPTFAPTATSLPEGSLAVAPVGAGTSGCVPTTSDGPGPNYTPGAPVRDSVGSGYTLTGTVLLPETCMPAAGALIEVWMAGPDGVYTDDYRASLTTDSSGRFRFQSHAPPGYSGGSPHIHVRVSAPDHRELFLVHQPAAGAATGELAAVLAPE